MKEKTAYRGSIFTFKQSATLYNIPRKKSDPSDHFLYIEDGVLMVEDGIIKKVGDYSKLKNEIDGIKVVDYKDKLITPGFIDTHIHAAQSGVVAAYGEKLLEWLNNYVFPFESTYEHQEAAKKDLNFFLDQLIQNGTTTACAFGPLFYEATDIFFTEIDKRNMRFITGNILMNINSPDYFRLSTKENYDNAERLVKKWHNKNRLHYSLCPRFALSCSEEMLELSGQLKKQYPDIYLQTHLDENLNEIKEVKKIFPWSKHYLDVYDRYNLVTDRSIFGHCIHTTDEELALFKASQAIIAWCPISNNFLGSGLFDFDRTSRFTENITLATDVGAGNTFSMFAVMDDAYKVCMLQSYKLPSMLRWFMATLGTAKALKISDKVGSLESGKEADFIVIDPQASPILKYRSSQVNDIFELLFILMTLADDRQIKATYILGNCAYESDL